MRCLIKLVHGRFAVKKFVVTPLKVPPILDPVICSILPNVPLPTCLLVLPL